MVGRRKGGRKGKSDGIAEEKIAHYAKGLNDGYDKGKKEVFDDIDKKAVYEEDGIRWLNYREYLKIKEKHLPRTHNKRI